VSSEPPVRGPLRWLWLLGGVVSLVLGGIGALVPGLPTTVFLIVAAACFARSSPRLEAWVLGLPRFGPMVRDYRDGLGMPRRTKAVAVSALVAAVGVSAALLDGWTVRWVVIAVGAVGAAWILWRVPTREVVERRRRPAG
jgi:uncharacterized membrane protein YbaN (DUF454 family)